MLVFEETADLTKEQWEFVRKWKPLRNREMKMNANERIWAGQFGDDYAKRSPGNVEANIEFFKRALAKASAPVNGTVLELGAGVGSNLVALKRLHPSLEISAVEINETAMEALVASGAARHTYLDFISTWPVPKKYDLVFTKGVLIHIPLEEFARAAQTIYDAADRYILLAEYYSPQRVEVQYRGCAGLLWKDDFAGRMLAFYPDLKLLDYGFIYRRDPCPQDDLTWFLLEKMQ